MGKIGIGKDAVPERTVQELPGFDGCLLSFEVHGVVHGVVSRLNPDQKQALAAHHHDGRKLGDNARLIADRLIETVKLHLRERMILFPGEDAVAGFRRPTTIEFIGESDYGPKAGLNAKKAEARASAWASRRYGDAAVMTDCVVRRFAAWCKSQDGVEFTDPPAGECDGTSAARGVSDPPPGHTRCYSCVPSGDSDIVMCPFGPRDWTLLLPGSQPGTFRVYDRSHKVKTIADLLLLSEIPGVADGDYELYSSYEMLHLVVMMLTPHDYWTRHFDGAHRNTTGFGKVALERVFKEVGELASKGEIKKPNECARNCTPNRLATILADWLCERLPWISSKNPDLLGRPGSHLIPNVLAFVNHPVAVSVGTTKRCSFWKVAHGLADGLMVKPTAPATVNRHTCSGNCGDCGADGADAPPSLVESLLKARTLRFVKVTSVEKGEETGHSPRMLVSDVVACLDENHATLEWGDSRHNNDTLNLVLQVIDRAHRITELKVATVPPHMLPDSNPSKTNAKLRTVVVAAKSPQSYGTMMKVKEQERDKGHYAVHVAFLVDASTGDVVEVLETRCLCRSCYDYCRHVTTLMVAVSRLEADHYMTSTSGGEGHWQGRSLRNPADCDVANRALGIGELTPNFVFLSDVYEQDPTEGDVSRILG